MPDELSSDGSGSKSEVGITTRQMRSAIEQRLFGKSELATLGRYELAEPVGRGGMGVVFRARDPSLEREVAVKVLSGSVIGSQRSGLVARLLREARLLARLNHPNVVAVHDVGEHDDDVFIAMEYVRGRTLRGWMDEHPLGSRQRLNDGLSLMLDAGRGLGAAHAIGLVHRDFKPDNVLIGDDGRVRVVDFGLAHGQLEVEHETLRSSDSGNLDTLTGTGQLVGTPAYMAPEQFEGAAVEAAADQYAFCVTLFELAYGCRPFSASSVKELATRVQAEPVRFPDTPTIPRGLQRILERGLAREPAQRFPDIEQLLEAIVRLRGGRRRLAGLALLVAGGIAGAVATLSLSSATEPACTDAAAPIDAVWSPSVAAEIDAAFAATGRPYAGPTAARANAAVDDFAQRWRAARVDACEDTLVRAEHSTEVMDRRAACLHRALRETGALVEAWRDADAKTVDTAAQAAGRLPALDPCEQIDSLLAVAPPPADPEMRASVDQVVGDSARARGLANAGRYTDAAGVLEGLLVTAEATEHAPTVADVLESTARVQLALGDREKAIASARAGFSAALRGANDRIAMQIAVHIAFRKAGYEGDPAGAFEWTEVARSLAARIGGDAKTEANTARVDGIAHVIAWHPEDAMRELERARDLYRELGNEAQVLVVTSDMAGAYVEAGDLARAEPLFESVIAAEREMYGDDHPRVANSRIGLGILKTQRDELADAQRLIEEAVGSIERVRPEHVDLGYGLTALGNVLMRRGEATQAIDALERAATIRLAHLGEGAAHVLETQRSLASAYVLAGRMPEGAALFERVLATSRRHLAPDDPELALTLGTAAGKLLTAGEPARAQALGREALELIDASKLATDVHRRHVLGAYAEVLVDVADVGAAVDVSRRNLEVAERDPATSRGDVAAARFLHARALELTGDRDAARSMVEASLDDAPADADHVEEAQTWLERHPPR